MRAHWKQLCGFVALGIGDWQLQANKESRCSGLPTRKSLDRGGRLAHAPFKSSAGLRDGPQPTLSKLKMVGCCRLSPCRVAPLTTLLQLPRACSVNDGTWPREGGHCTGHRRVVCAVRSRRRGHAACGRAQPPLSEGGGLRRRGAPGAHACTDDCVANEGQGAVSCPHDPQQDVYLPKSSCGWIPFFKLMSDSCRLTRWWRSCRPSSAVSSWAGYNQSAITTVLSSATASSRRTTPNVQSHSCYCGNCRYAFIRCGCMT